MSNNGNGRKIFLGFFVIGGACLACVGEVLAQSATEAQVAEMLDGYYAAVSFEERLPFIAQEKKDVVVLAAKVYGDLNDVNPMGMKRVGQQIVKQPTDNQKGRARVVVESLTGEKNVYSFVFVLKDGKCKVDWIDSLRDVLVAQGLVNTSRIAKDESLPELTVFDIGEKAPGKVRMLGLSASQIVNNTTAGFGIGWPAHMDKSGWV